MIYGKFDLTLNGNVVLEDIFFGGSAEYIEIDTSVIPLKHAAGLANLLIAELFFDQPLDENGEEFPYFIDRVDLCDIGNTISTMVDDGRSSKIATVEQEAVGSEMMMILHEKRFKYGEFIQIVAHAVKRNGYKVRKEVYDIQTPRVNILEFDEILRGV